MMESGPVLKPLWITLARALDREHVDYRVLARSIPLANAPAKTRWPQDELATIELNRRICFPDGRIHAIVHHGGLLSTERELHGGSNGGTLPLAIYRRERTGLLGHRHILIVSGETERRYLLRRRHWFGSPANVDVVPLLGAELPPADSVVLHAEKSGTWRQRLQAMWLAPKELPLPVALFVLNVLADLDRRAALAASAGAAGL